MIQSQGGLKWSQFHLRVLLFSKQYKVWYDAFISKPIEIYNFEYNNFHPVEKLSVLDIPIL